MSSSWERARQLSRCGRRSIDWRPLICRCCFWARPAPEVNALFALLRYHRYGRALRAVFQNREAAALRGVNVRAVYRMSLILGNGVIFAGGVLFAFAYAVDLTVAWTMSVTAFAIMIIGGPGSVVGALVVGMVFGFTQAIVSAFASPTIAAFSYLGAMLVMGVLVFLKQYLLDHELLGLLRTSQNSLDDLRQLQARLVQSEKLASLGQLVGGAAHELNNPLTGILGNAELLLAEVHRKNDGTLPRGGEQRLETIAALAVRLRETVRRLSQEWEGRQHSVH